MEFNYSTMFPLKKDNTEYIKLSDSYIKQENFYNQKILIIDPNALKLISEKAFFDVSHLFRSSHLIQLKKILDDPLASDNDHFVAKTMLKNANISSAGVLPMCQDTGTAIVNCYKGDNVFTGVDDGRYLSEGIYECYKKHNLRFL